MKLEFLNEIYEHPGPFATVYLDTSGDAEDANKARELRWRAAREQLASQGAPEETLDALSHTISDDTFQQPRAGRKGQVLIAVGDRVLFTDELESPPTQFSDDERATYSAVPHLMPYLRTRSSRAPHLLVMIDREGADITSVSSTNKKRTQTEVGKYDPPARKSRETARGGDEQTHFNAVEEQWRTNANAIADQISREANEYGADVIVLGGDPQIRSVLQERLHPEIEKLVVETDASHRGANESNDHLRDAIDAAVTSAVTAQVKETVNTFKEKRGNNGTAAEGWKEIIEALQAGQVQTLLWARTADGGSDQGTLSIGSEPNLVAADDVTLQDIGSEWVRQVQSEDAILRAAVGTGAELVFVDRDQVSLTENVGAVLRFSTDLSEDS